MQESLLDPIEQHLGTRSRESMDAILSALIEMFPDVREHLSAILCAEMARDEAGTTFGITTASEDEMCDNRFSDYYASVTNDEPDIDRDNVNAVQSLSISCHPLAEDDIKPIRLDITAGNGFDREISVQTSRAGEEKNLQVLKGFKHRITGADSTTTPNNSAVLRAGLEEIREEIERFVKALAVISRSQVRQVI